MGMVVRTNTMAVNANRQLGMNNTQVAKSLEKLSSGFKINRAGDDASGLAISEKMKAQIKGLEQASANSQDGISLVQTAEGALTEVHSMLNRMVELATKSANGTIQDDVDRENIQNEVDALISEIDRIGDSTNFNGINLLDGSLGNSKGITASAVKLGSQIASAASLVPTNNAATGQIVELGAKTYDAGVDIKGGDLTVTLKDGKGMSKDVTVHIGAIANGTSAADVNSMLKDKLTEAGLDKYFKIEVGVGGAVVGAGTADTLKFTALGDYTIAQIKAGGDLANNGDAIFGDQSGANGVISTTELLPEQPASTDLKIGANALAAGDFINVNGKIYEFVENEGDAVTNKGATAINLGANFKATVENLNSALKKAGYQAQAVDIDANGAVTPTAGGATATTVIRFTKSESTATVSGNGLTLQIGDSNDDFNKVTVEVDDMRSASLGVSGLDVSTQEAAGNSIQTIRDAINTVSMNRGNLGALQNRLEYTINNLDVSAENMTAANSRIRDTDMAKEMMNYTKMNVLVQSAQAMLAQANQQPQSILQLLQ